MHVPFDVKDELLEIITDIQKPRNRYTGDEAAAKQMEVVEEYIVNRLKGAGWDTDEQSVIYEENITNWDYEHKGLKGKNIVATLQGETEKTVIIACHHDAVPKSPGADDNGTGVAVLLLLARLLQMQGPFVPSLMLVSFDFEEIGLLGSSYFVEHYDEYFQSKDQILGVFVLESIGYYADDKEQILPAGFGILYRRIVNSLRRQGKLYANFLTVIYNGDSIPMIKSFKEMEKQLAPLAVPIAPIRYPVDIPIIGPILKKIVPSVSNLLRSDNTPFWEDRIPAVMITDTTNFRNPNYHLPSDTVDTLNFQSLADVTIFIYKVILHFIGKPLEE